MTTDIRARLQTTLGKLRSAERAASLRASRRLHDAIRADPAWKAFLARHQ